MVCENLQQKTTHKERENNKLQGLQRQKGSGECIWNPGKQIQSLTGHNGAKAKGCQRDCFDMCCVAQHAESTPRRPRQGTHQADDTAALQNEQVLYMPENYRNPSREAKHQQDLLKDYFNHIGALAGQEKRI